MSSYIEFKKAGPDLLSEEWEDYLESEEVSYYRVSYWGFNMGPPPGEHGYIWITGTCMGWWGDRYDLFQQKMIDKDRYLDAIEAQLDLGYKYGV